MQPVLSQPGAAPIPRHLVESLRARLAGGAGKAEVSDVVSHDQYSNDVAEVRFTDGRTLMVKRGRYDWTADRFATSRAASLLLRRRAGVVAPEPLPLPVDIDPRPVEAYWRIELPTLQEVWGALDGAARDEALRTWGELLRRIHRVRLPECGPLHGGWGTGALGAYLRAELERRLLPAAHAVWRGEVGTVERLTTRLEALELRVGATPPVLVHNDVHMGNVVCEVGGGGVRCVGMLDLEAAFAGPFEADLAVLEVLHGPLFSRPLGGRWFERVIEGYGVEPDPLTLGFFRAYHLVNLGLYSALVGHHGHAAEVAAAARRETEALGAPRAGPARSAEGESRHTGTGLAPRRSGGEAMHPGGRGPTCGRHPFSTSISTTR